MKTIYILATGGTIAGSAQNCTTSKYNAGSKQISEIIKQNPEIYNLADIKTGQISNIDSKDMTDEILIKLANKVNEILFLVKQWVLLI